MIKVGTGARKNLLKAIFTAECNSNIKTSKVKEEKNWFQTTQLIMLSSESASGIHKGRGFRYPNVKSSKIEASERER